VGFSNLHVLFSLKLITLPRNTLLSFPPLPVCIIHEGNGESEIPKEKNFLELYFNQTSVYSDFFMWKILSSCFK